MTTLKHSRHNPFINGILCLLCFFVALSFIAPLAPIASASSDSTMPCCKGKAGHCDSGIAPKRVLPPTSEPMCGLKDATMEDDGITIVAEPSQIAETNSSHPAAESASLSQPCRMDCGACLASSTRTQKRDRILVPAIALRLSSTATADQSNYLSLPFSSNDDWTQTSPRGPPADLL